MSIRRHQLQYGALWGVTGFAVGLVATYALVPADFHDAERWRTAAWVFLNANGVMIAGIRALGISGLGSNVDFIEATGRFRALYTLPPLLVTLGAVLTADSLPYTTRPKYVLQNTAATVAGYLGAALVTIFVSGARPAVAIVVLLAGLLGGGLFVGSTVANRLTGNLPVFGVTTLGGLAAIGLAVIFGGVTVVTALLPVLVICLGGTVAATVLLLIVRSF